MKEVKLLLRGLCPPNSYEDERITERSGYDFSALLNQYQILRGFRYFY